MGDNDTGCMTIDPIVVTLKEGCRLPRVPQYKISKEGEAGLKQVVSDLVHKGIVKEITASPCNSPILQVVKKNTSNDKDVYRLVVDLREINKIVQPQYPVVPYMNAVFIMIPPDAITFSVIDLKNAFFSIPIAIESQYLVAFSLGGRSFTFTRAPQESKYI